MWSTEEISIDHDVWAEHMPNLTMSVKGDIIVDCDKFYDFLDIRDVEVDVEINMAMEEFICEGLEEEITIDDDEEAKTYTYLTTEMELYDSGASHHMLPYQHKFINFVSIQKELLTTGDRGHFEVVGKGECV